MKIHRGLENISEINNPILTVGTFDGVHIGHQKIIKRINEIAKAEQGESVLLTFYPHPRMVIFPEDDSLKLINTIEEKINILDSFGLQHLIIVPFAKEFSRIHPVEYVRNILINTIGIKKMVIGYDHHFGRNREGNIELLKELAPLYEFSVEEISAQEVDEITVSSTKIRQGLINGELEKVNEYLNYPFFIIGKVIKGKQLGRSLGFPTANIELPAKHKALPANGVYQVSVLKSENTYNGIANIGHKPTLHEEKEAISLEVHLFDFNGDLYDQEVKVSFFAKIRDEKTFSTLDDLKTQIEADVNLVKKLQLP